LSARLAEIGNKFLPTAASIVAAGFMFFPGMEGANFLMSRALVANAIRSIPILKSPRAGPIISLVMGAVQVALFLGAYQIASSTFGIEKSVKQFLLTDFSLDQNNILLPFIFVPLINYYPIQRLTVRLSRTDTVPATTYTEAETQLYAEWSRIKKNKW